MNKIDKLKKGITCIEIRDIEQRVLNYMLISASNYNEVLTELQEREFLFAIHQRIFSQLVFHKDHFLKNSDFSPKSLHLVIETFAFTVWRNKNVKEKATVEILSQQASKDIKNDIETMQTLYAQRVQKENNIYTTVIVEDKRSHTKAYFMNGIVTEIATRGIMYLPKELFFYFKDLLDYLAKADLQAEDIEVKTTLDEDTNEIKSLHIKKDLSELKWIDNLCQWADKYGLDEKIFPRNREQLEDLKELDLTGKGINELPKEICKLQNLRLLHLCNNNIVTLPEEVFSMRALVDFCIHSNQITAKNGANRTPITLLSGHQ